MEVEGAIIPSEGKLVAPDAYSQSVNLVYEFAVTMATLLTSFQKQICEGLSIAPTHRLRDLLNNAFCLSSCIAVGRNFDAKYTGCRQWVVVFEIVHKVIGNRGLLPSLFARGLDGYILVLRLDVVVADIPSDEFNVLAEERSHSCSSTRMEN